MDKFKQQREKNGSYVGFMPARLQSLPAMFRWSLARLRPKIVRLLPLVVQLPSGMSFRLHTFVLLLYSLLVRFHSFVAQLYSLVVGFGSLVVYKRSWCGVCFLSESLFEEFNDRLSKDKDDADQKAYPERRKKKLLNKLTLLLHSAAINWKSFLKSVNWTEPFARYLLL